MLILNPRFKRPINWLNSRCEWNGVLVAQDKKVQEGAASEGDEVTVSFVCKTLEGDVVASSQEEDGEDLTFEVRN